MWYTPIHGTNDSVKPPEPILTFNFRVSLLHVSYSKCAEWLELHVFMHDVPSSGVFAPKYIYIQFAVLGNQIRLVCDLNIQNG